MKPNRMVVVAPHFPEYAVRYSRAMSRHYAVLAVVDDSQYLREINFPLPADPAFIYRANFRTPLDLLRILAKIFAHRPSIIHLHESAGARRGAMLCVIAVTGRLFSKVLLTVHDPIPHSGRDSDRAGRARFSRNLLRRMVHSIVVHGQYCAEAYLRYGLRPRQRLLVSDHGVILSPDPPQHITTTTSNGCGSSSDSSGRGVLRLLCFGRMEAYKGIEVLLDAVEKLSLEDTPIHLTVAGQGPELDRLEGRFSALGFVAVLNQFIPAWKAVRLIQDSECVVLPYIDATQSGVLASAYGCGRYAIASNVGGLPDVVHDRLNGLLVIPGDSNSLADAIRLLVASDMRQKLTDGAEATAAGQLNWERITDALRDDL